MGCICSKENEKENSTKFNTIRFCRTICNTKMCKCFDCFKNSDVNYANEITSETVVNIDDLELVKVNVPSVKINDIETTSEKIKNTFKGVYMRERSLHEFINKKYLESKNNTENDTNIETNG